MTPESRVAESSTSPRMERLRRLMDAEYTNQGARAEAARLVVEECEDILRRTPAAPFCSPVPVLVVLLLVILAEEAW